MKILVIFEENGSEYTGSLRIVCNTWEKLDDCKIKVDNVEIEIDENIISIEEIEQ